MFLCCCTLASLWQCLCCCALVSFCHRIVFAIALDKWTPQNEALRDVRAFTAAVLPTLTTSRILLPWRKNHTQNKFQVHRKISKISTTWVDPLLKKHGNSISIVNQQNRIAGANRQTTGMSLIIANCKYTNASHQKRSTVTTKMHSRPFGKLSRAYARIECRNISSIIEPQALSSTRRDESPASVTSSFGCPSDNLLKNIKNENVYIHCTKRQRAYIFGQFAFYFVQKTFFDQALWEPHKNAAKLPRAPQRCKNLRKFRWHTFL